MDLDEAKANMALMDALRNNHPDLKDTGFALAANIGALKCGSVSFPDEMGIRKAHANEAATFQSLLPNICPSEFFRPHPRNPYETSTTTVEDCPGQSHQQLTFLAPEQWKYHVITFKGTNAPIYDLAKASLLTQKRIRLGPTVSASRLGFGIGFGPDIARLWKDLMESDEGFLTLDAADVEDTCLVYTKLATFPQAGSRLHDAINRFSDLDAVPPHSPLRFLGYVSILESLITHKPKPTDPNDSLTRQVRQKMLLLGSRAKLPIPYDMFGQTPPDTLWGKLYEYRSAIAHGETADFKGKLECLKSADIAQSFIIRATVAVLRQALEEPELVAHLREV